MKKGAHDTVDPLVLMLAGASRESQEAIFTKIANEYIVAFYKRFPDGSAADLTQHLRSFIGAILSRQAEIAQCPSILEN
jgi:hypothetical protein